MESLFIVISTLTISKPSISSLLQSRDSLIQVCCQQPWNSHSHNSILPSQFLINHQFGSTVILAQQCQYKDQKSVQQKKMPGESTFNIFSVGDNAVSLIHIFYLHSCNSNFQLNYGTIVISILFQNCDSVLQ